MLHLMKYIKHLFLGRGPMLTDVILDSMGVMLGILLVMLAIKIYKNIHKKQKNDKNILNATIND